MNSPWISGNQGEQYTVPGLPALLEASNARRTQAINDLGSFGGQLAAGVVGAVEAAKNPQAFGEGASAGFAALKGGLMNFNKAATGTGPSFAQFAALGKTADSLRDAVKTQTPSTPDQQPRVMGYTDDEWKHIGTDRKIGAMQGFVQNLNAEQMMQAYELGQQHLAQAQQDAAAQSNFQAWAKAEPVRRGAQLMAAGAGPVNPPALSPMDYFAGAVNAGVDPAKASQMGENLSRMAALGAKQDLGNTVPKRVELGGTPVIYSERTGTFQIDPAYAINQRAQNAKDLLNQRLAGLSAADQLKSLDTQQKAVEGDLMLTTDEKQAKLAAIDAARQELVNKKQGAAPPAAPVAGRFKIVGVK